MLIRCSLNLHQALLVRILYIAISVCISPHPPRASSCPCTSTSSRTLCSPQASHSQFLWLLLELADPDTLLLSPARGSDGSGPSVDGLSPSWACQVCPAHCPLQWTPSLPCSSHRKLLTSTGTTKLSHAGLADSIGIAIYDLCSKCNIPPQFWPQTSLVMQL